MLQASRSIQRLMILHSWSSNVQCAVRGFCQNPSWMSICHLIVRTNCMYASFVRLWVTSILKEQGNMKKLAVRIPRLRSFCMQDLWEKIQRQKGEEETHEGCPWWCTSRNLIFLWPSDEMRGNGVAIERWSGYYAAMSFAVFFTIFQAPLDVTISIARQLRGDWWFMRRWLYRRTSDFYSKLFYCVPSSCSLWCSWMFLFSYCQCFCALVRQFALFIPALWDFISTFQQNDISGKPACPEFYSCSKLVSYVVVFFVFFFNKMFYCVLATCVILIVHMFPKLRIQWGQKVLVLRGIKWIGGINPVNMFINISLFSWVYSFLITAKSLQTITYFT